MNMDCATETPAFCSPLALRLSAAPGGTSASWPAAAESGTGRSRGRRRVGIGADASTFTATATNPRRAILPISSSPSPSHTRTTTSMTLAATPASTNSSPSDGDDLVRELHGADDYLDALHTYKDELLVLKVYAPWCRSCRALVPKMNRLARQFRGDVRFVKINYEENKELCRRLGVYSMPTFIVYDGKVGEVDKFTCGPARAGVLSRKVIDIMRGYCLFDEHRDKQVKQPAYNKK